MIGWLARSLEDVPPDDGWMSPIERARLACLHVPKRRADFRLGRWTAHAALRAASNVTGWSVRARDDGSPEALLDGEPAELSLSISHSQGRALASVGPSHVALGCDLEHVVPRAEALVLDFFDDDERARLPTNELRDRAVTLIWSAKESALKALRVGLRADPRAANVRTSGDRLEVRIEGRTLHGAFVFAGDRLGGRECRRATCTPADWVQTVVADPWIEVADLKAQAVR